MGLEIKTGMAVNQMELDHVVIACVSIEQAHSFLCDKFDFDVKEIPFLAGGKHEFMGTRNVLVGLRSPQHSDIYLEFICVDPSLPRPAKKRWFGLDSEVLRERLERNGPELLHYVMRVESNIEQVRDLVRDRGVDLGNVLHASRTKPDGSRIEWQITVREEGDLLLSGALPTLIQWNDLAMHPSKAMNADQVKVGLRYLRIIHQLQPEIKDLIELFGSRFSTLTSYDSSLSNVLLEAAFDTPKGPVILRSCVEHSSLL